MKMKKGIKIVAVTAFSLVGLCILLIVISVISNLGLPQSSLVVQNLSQDDKIRLNEALHLRQAVGDLVWPGWGQADIPVILYNESVAFLVGYPEPSPGWIKVPSGDKRGGAWEVVPGDAFNSEPYYRQTLPDPAITPEAFTVQVGNR
jgi:hypothetical protein